MQTNIGDTRLILICGDITEQETDAIVNAANPGLMGGGGVDGAIHRKGGPDILKELKAKKVIHTVGPVWHGGNNKEPQLLADAYMNSLKVAIENGIKTISFPSISTGAYGYPVEKASVVAVNAVIGFLEEFSCIKEVRFILHSSHDLAIYELELTGITSKAG